MKPTHFGSNKLLLLIAIVSVQICFIMQSQGQEKSPQELRDAFMVDYNSEGKKFSKYFPGAYYYIDGSVGKILNDGVFKQQVNACKFVGKRFRKVDSAYRNYMPSNIRDWSGGNFGIDNNGLLIRTSAGDLIKSVMTSQERTNLLNGTIDINSILIQKRQIKFSNERIEGLTILDASKAKNNFAYNCSCSGFVNFAISGGADKIPLGRFKTGFQAEATNTASLFLLEGNFRSPLYSQLSLSTPSLDTFIDLWNYYVDLSNREGGAALLNQDLFYISEFNGILTGHEQNSSTNKKIQTELKIDANVNPVQLTANFDSGSEKKENFVGQNWNIIAYGDLTDKKKYQIYTDKLPSILETKNKIQERIVVLSQEDANVKAIASNSNYIFYVRLKGLNKTLCNPASQFRYNHTSGSNFWQNVASVAVVSSYDDASNDCVCKISGWTGANAAPIGSITNYSWRFSLKHPSIVNNLNLEFEGSHNESSTRDPRLLQNMVIVQNGMVPRNDNSNSFVWEVPLRVIDNERGIRRSNGTLGQVDGTPVFSTVGGDSELLSSIIINELKYIDGGYVLKLELPNITSGRFISDFTNQFHEVIGTVKVLIPLADNSNAVVNVEGIKLKLPLYIDDDKDGVPDYKDLCKGYSSNSNGDSDGDGIGDPCDLCPSLSNTLLENIDTDKDGIGDKCDKCPNDATNSCVAARGTN